MGIAHYNALQATLEKRLSNGVYALVSYTCSKCMDNGSSETGPPTISLLAQNYGVCSYDITNNLTLSSIYQLPFGKGRIFLSNASWPVRLRWAAGNWPAFSWIAPDFLSLRPLAATSRIPAFRVNGRIASAAAIFANPTALKWFDTTAFTIPAQYTYGNSRRDILRSDGLVDLDMTVKKNFNFTESKIHGGAVRKLQPGQSSNLLRSQCDHRHFLRRQSNQHTQLQSHFPSRGEVLFLRRELS